MAYPDSRSIEDGARFSASFTADAGADAPSAPRDVESITGEEAARSTAASIKAAAARAKEMVVMIRLRGLALWGDCRAQGVRAS